ncbi:GntR family transcriptional regulator [Actinopolymorpha pittospori]
MENAGLKHVVEPLKLGHGPVPQDAAERLGLDAGDEVMIRQRRYVAEGYPLEIAASYIPLDIAAGTPIEQWNPGPGGIYARIEDAGHRLVRFTEEIAVRPGTNSELNALNLPVGSSILRILRTAHAEDRAVEVCETIMNPAAFELHYELPAR